MKRKIVVALACLAVVAGCSNNSGGGPVNKFGDPIIGDQFTDPETQFDNGPRFVSIVKLNEPSLLSSVKRLPDGTYKIDEQAKQAVLDEQAAFEQKLKDLSSDINIIKSYKMVLNAIAVDAPQDLADQINQLDMDYIEADERFHLPTTEEVEIAAAKTRQFVTTSMTHIGVDKVRAKYTHTNSQGQTEPLLGQGIKVGIIDTGIDYIHTMMGGSGNVAQYQAIDANAADPAFPNDKVVGGYDFVGETFNTGSHIFSRKVPNPDANPLDRSGHGTHVAGTVAGLGDGVNTYDGVAPAADLYALKVFGDQGGSTSDTVVIAALEFAVDPNGDLDLSDKLDVVNLSLGGAFGKPHNLYAQAVKNLVKGGVVTVAAAGNAGPINNIVGAPSTSDDAISVAASIDSMDHNWKFDAVRFVSKNNPSLLSEFAEGAISKPLAQAGTVSGKLVAIGVADQDLEPDVKAALAGNVALIDRGNVSFVDKFKRAVDAGAIGVVMVNNQPGAPIPMGGDENFDIPGVMIALEMGEIIKADMEGTDVSVEFQVSEQIEKPELIDTITGFSSQGPRDLDGAIKPEISAPGFRIISARAGSGSEGVMNNGTSMASPHIAGVAALVVQQKKNIEAKDVKSVLMNSAVLISDADKIQYPISRQGAGRVDVLKAMETDVVFSMPGISLGKLPLVDALSLSETMMVKNIGDSSVNYSLAPVNAPNMTVTVSESQVSLEPGEEMEIKVDIQASAPQEERVEMDGFIAINSGGSLIGNIPVLGVANKSSALRAVELTSLKGDPKAGDTVSLTLENTHSEAGSALVFNLLGKDERKDQSIDKFFSVACDLQSAGYRIVSDGDQKFLQIAVKLFNPITTWNTCDISVEIDRDGDGKADLEILGSSLGGLPGLPSIPGVGFVSAVFDSNKLNAIFADYTKEIAKQEEERPTLDFSPALEDLGPMVAFENSTVAILDVAVAGLKLTDGKADIKITAQANLRDVVERNDVLEVNGSPTIALDLNDGAESYTDLPEVIDVPANGSTKVDLVKGAGDENIIVYFPRNEFTLNTQQTDLQSQEMMIDSMPRALKP